MVVDSDITTRIPVELSRHTLCIMGKCLVSCTLQCMSKSAVSFSFAL